jgi:cytosine/adenosine deaminase-related metal-dependent hydrolase
MYPSSPDKPTSTKSSGQLLIYQADAVVDAVSPLQAPGAVAVRDGVIEAAGTPTDVRRAVGRADQQFNSPDTVLMPGLVNAHVHLELTAVGPREYTGDFVHWLQMVRQAYPNPEEPMCDANRRYFARSASVGAKQALEAGSRVVGDISRFDEVYRAVAAEGMQGTSYVELFGLGEPWSGPSIDRINELAGEQVDRRLRRGVQPHAPYSAGPMVFRAAAGSGLPLATHLAETPEELQFVASGDGAYREMLKAMGKWDDAFAADYNRGQTPVEWLAECCKTSALLAHCNYVTDSDIARVAEKDWSVAYCPRASVYFAHANHRYRDMLAAGVNVALGTDSIICHGTLSILDEMRHLYRRDRFDPRRLLAMATINGMKALLLDPADATFEPGRSPGLLAVPYDGTDAADPLAAALMNDKPLAVLEASL